MNKRFTLSENTRLDTGIAQTYPDLFSRAKAQKLIREEKVRVNGKTCAKPSFASEMTSEVDFDFEPETSFVLKPNDKGVPIVYQDNDLAIIHKPSGITVHPGAGNRNDTLVHSLLAQLETLSTGVDPQRPGIIHRLDRETEGLMVVAKTNLAHRVIAEAFQNREVEKEYLAWVWGRTEAEGVAEGFIGRHRTIRRKMVFLDQPQDETWKSASLDYRLEKWLDPFSLVRIRLHTGRTHQIRATFSYLNHPVVGDPLYSKIHRRVQNAGLSANTEKILEKRGMLLIASRLSFQHPTSGKKLEFTLPLPERFHLDTLMEIKQRETLPGSGANSGTLEA